MIQKEIEFRKIPQTLPEGLRKENWNEYRKEMIALFSREEYGVTPEAPESIRAEESKGVCNWASKHEHRHVRLSFDTPMGEYAFEFDITFPGNQRPAPLFVALNFHPYPGGQYCPLEEVLDGGFAVASIYYKDITADADDGFSTGIAKMYPRRNDGTDWGKIGMWAFAASRVMDYAQSLPEIDKSRIYVTGHSRLGKTALWCAAQDERFAGVVSNNSGAGGAAVMRGKIGEQLSDSISMVGYWYADNYKNYVGRAEALPFDQHQLLSLIAPRLLCVGSASLDSWADPESEFLSAFLASDAYRLLGEEGLVSNGCMPNAGENLFEGKIGYHYRCGAHFFSRDDWNAYMDFFKKHFE